jgi:serine/threonine protein kinase
LQNRYLILRLLAEGGMGAVYEATDQRLGNRVALKETFFTDEEMRRAFHREAALLATLRHQALPKVIDHFTEGAGQFLVMEFIRGDDLSRLMKLAGGPIPQRDALAWADQLLGAVEYLHAQRPPIIHRDIKPQNLKLNERGEIILLDFGLAKESAGTGAINRSVRGYTLVYAPLEQIQGTGTDPRSDLYSVAATVYHLLTGVAPADAVTRATAMVEGRPDPLRPAHEVNPGVSPAISSALAAALSPDRNRRPSTAAAMRAELRQAAAEAQRLPPPPIFHTQPRQATPLNPAAPPTQAEARPTLGYAVPPTAAMTTNVPPLAPSPNFYAIEPEPKRGTKRVLVIGGVLLAAVITLMALFWTRKSVTDSTLTGKPAATTVIAGATQIASRELLLGGGPETRLYTFTALPGELRLTLNVIGKGSSVAIEAFDAQKNELPFSDGRSELALGSAGPNEQSEARLIVEREMPVLLAIETAYPDSLQAMRLRIEGPAKLSDARSSSPLNKLFAARDNPKPLAQAAVYGGQGAPAESYYQFRAGPGEIKFALDILGNGSGTEVELFDENSRKINFASGSSFSVSSTGQHERSVSSLLLASRQKLLMRLQTTYADSLQAFRLKLDGPVESTAAGTTSADDSAGKALDPIFAMRDNPLPLNSKELSSNKLDKDYYYLLRAGPGTVTFEIELSAAGSTFSVELFNADAKPVNFDNGSNKFSVASTGEKARGKAEVTLGAEEKLLMRISNTYPDSMKNYKLKLDGAIKKAFGE